ncbi:hypothetical protein BJ138DRAFT_1140303 [Hygrophoropsis aurantiaca]|uniref:Uncharacterized protein n=1 Tax=Hygrophoropsis aurantiaca TaxID=72124 RepID=A0ACB8ARY2_9AGAM|nr:hypothetical protein BJ138DRAFT_1140303 [Hygrophoropsis aurantiaca]
MVVSFDEICWAGSTRGAANYSLHSGNHFLIDSNGASNLSCTGFLVIQSVMTQTLVTMVEIVLVLRVHALYNRSRRMGAFLFSLAALGSIIAIIGLALSIPDTQFDSMCAITRAATSATCFM